MTAVTSYFTKKQQSNEATILFEIDFIGIDVIHIVGLGIENLLNFIYFISRYFIVKSVVLTGLTFFKNVG